MIEWKIIVASIAPESTGLIIVQDMLNDGWEISRCDAEHNEMSRLVYVMFKTQPIPENPKL